MVMKSSPVGSMHIFTRRSSWSSMSHALAWHTTSRSRGFTSIDRSQKVPGSESSPSEVKKPSPKRVICAASRFFARISSVRSYPAPGAFRGATIG
jgi:hypothetical protein